MTHAENIERFEKLLLSVNREGIDELLNFIRKSDFYTAPASTRYHSCHEGGLLEHSLNVYDCLMEKRNNKYWKPVLDKYSDETLALISLTHDLCKTYYYVTEMRNKKDESGNWVQVPFYTVDDKYPLGHGCHSVFFLQMYIKLTIDEIAAINFHMGFSEPRENYAYVGKAMQKWTITLALHEADCEATYLLEEES